MARSGRFGRLPRAAPDLTATLVAIAREMAAQEDANMFEAWESGGEVNGKKVTDEMLLEHIQKRRDGLAKDDPLWTRWDQTLDNYTFSIEESKISLRYAQGAVSDMQMADFYKRWAGKLPRNSEAYRNLMRSAAQFMDAAKSRGGGGGGGGGGRGRGGGSQAAYDASAQAAYDKYERMYDVATDLLTSAAYRAGILQITDTADPDDLADLRGGDEMDHARFLNLFDQINTDPAYADFRTALAEAGIENLTYARWLELGNGKAQGFEARIGLAYQFDDADGAEDISEDLMEFSIQQALLNDIDEIAAYQQVRHALDLTLAQEGLSPFEIDRALSRYENSLNRLDMTAASDQTRGFLNNELMALRGEGDFVGPTLFEMNEGGQRDLGTADADVMRSLRAETRAIVEEIDSGRAYMAWVPDPETGLVGWGTVPAQPGLGNEQNGMVIWTDVGKGRPPVPTFVQFFDITARAFGGADPRTGAAQFEVPTQETTPGSGIQSDAVVGKYYVLNGKTYYGVYDPTNPGDLLWFAEDPFLTSVTRTVGDDGGMMLQVLLPPDGDVEATGFDPFGTTVEQRLWNSAMFDPTVFDQDVPRAFRFNSPDEAFYYTSPEDARSLLRISDQRAAQLIAEQHGTGEEGAAAWDRFRDMRNTAVEAANSSGSYLIALEDQRLGLHPDANLIARAKYQPFQMTDEDSPFEQERREQFLTREQERTRRNQMAAQELAHGRAVAQGRRTLPGLMGVQPEREGPTLRVPNLDRAFRSADAWEAQQRSIAGQVRPTRAQQAAAVRPLRSPDPKPRAAPATTTPTPKPPTPKPIQPKPYEYASDPKETTIKTPKVGTAPSKKKKKGSGGAYIV